MKKKILAVFLSLCMAMSLLPVTALAAETGENTPSTQATTKLPEAVNGEITLEDDTSLAVTELQSALTSAYANATSLTIDLNEKKLTITGATTTGANTWIEVPEGKSLTFQNGEIEAKGYRGTSAVLVPLKDAALTLNQVTMNTDGAALYPNGNAASITVIDSNITGGTYVLGTNANKVEGDYEHGTGFVLTLTNSKLTATHYSQSAQDYDTAAVLINVPCTLTMDQCTVTAGRIGVFVRAGNATITNSTIKTTGQFEGGATQYHSGAWKDGNEAPAAGLTVGNYVNGAASSYEANAVVTLNNTSVTGENNFPAIYIDANTKYFADLNITGNSTITGAITKGQQTQKGAISITATGGTYTEDPKNVLTIPTGYEIKGDATPWTVGPKTDGMEAATESEGTTSSGSIGGTFTPNQKPDEDAGENEGTVDTTKTDVELNVTTGENGAADTTIKETTVTIEPATLTSVKDAGTDKVTSVSIATDVGTITLDKQAWNTITTNATTGDTTAQVTLSIKDVTGEDAAENTATYEITATANGKAVFAEDSATTGGEVTITVPAPTGVTDDVHVYYLGPNGAEEVSGAEVEGTNVSWTVEHFSTYYLTGAEQVASITKNGVTTSYGTLSEAVTAAQEDDTIVLLANITDENVGTSQNKSKTVLTFDKSVTIQGNGNKISIDLSVPKTFGERDQVFSIGEDKDSKVAVTFDNVKMTVAGKEEGKGDAFDVWGTLNITKGSNITVKDAQSAFTMQGGENAKVNIDKASTVTANNIHGNFSNGGIWTIKEGSTLDINTAGNHGLSVEELTVNNSTVSVNGAAYTGILAAKVTLKKDANVTVTNCGKDLPQESQWAPDEESYKNAMELKGETPTLTVDNSTLTLTNNVNSKKESINSIYLGNGTLTQRNDPTINVDKIFTSGEATTQYYVVTYMNGNQAVGKDTVSTSSGSKEATVTLMKALPNQGYNHFVGWNDGSKTYDAGTQVTISKDTIFTAVWSYIPPANPNYRIDIPDFEGGTVTADPTAAKAGATVTLTATPDEGYAVGTITVTDRFGDAVKVTENADGTYTFTMPNGQVTVKATFVETEEPAPAEPFPDVDENDWFYDEVVYVYENGLMNGVENNQFAPNTATNRAMLATILYRLAGQPDVSGDLPFTDVAAGTWYTDAVLWAAQNGIVNGLGENTFAPMNTLTREQLVTMLYRYAEAEGYDVSAAADLSGYPDAGKVQPYAQEAMSWAVAEGIVEGMDGNLNPAGNATRAQIATILMRFCEGVAK